MEGTCVQSGFEGLAAIVVLSTFTTPTAPYKAMKTTIDLAIWLHFSSKIIINLSLLLAYYTWLTSVYYKYKTIENRRKCKIIQF